MVGTGVKGYFGDGGPAIDAQLWDTRDVFLDSANNIYLADESGHRIRKVDAETGTISTVAGTGIGRYSGDGGLATTSSLNCPRKILVDSAGILYIADACNLRVRKVDMISGIITTVAGSGSSGMLGDGGLATDASISPEGITMDGEGNLYIAERNRVRKVDSSGFITTVAGTGDLGFSGDGGLATLARIDALDVFADDAGNLYVLDASSRVRKVDAAGTIVTLVLDATIRFPNDMFVDHTGVLYIADRRNYRVRKVDTSGSITTVAGGDIADGSAVGDDGPAIDANLRFPSNLFVDSTNNLYIADTHQFRIRKVDAESGLITTVVGNGIKSYSGDGGPAVQASLGFPSDVFLDKSGNIYIADSSNFRVRKVDSESMTITTIAGNGSSGFDGDGGPATEASLHPGNIFVDGEGNIFLVGSNNRRIRKVDAASGIITTVAGNGEFGISTDGVSATDASIGPEGIFVDGIGNIYFAEGNRVRMVDTLDVISTVAGNGQSGFSGDGGSAIAARLENALDVFIDGAGNLFIASNNRIRKVEASTGIISTVGGSGNSNYSGDGGPAILAGMAPDAVFVDGLGNLYIAQI